MDAAPGVLDLASLYFGHVTPPKHAAASYTGPLTVAHTEGNKEGRGLVTTRAVAKGELLMISNPIVSIDAEKIFEKFRAAKARPGESDTRLKDAADAEMLAELKALLSRSNAAAELIRCMADGQQENMPIPDTKLLNQDISELGSSSSNDAHPELSDEYLQRVLRFNANGPEFKHWRQVEEEWAESPNPFSHHRRLAGLYALPSMINHSCAANTLRVYVGDTMFVRAVHDLKEGQEVVWPYVAPLRPLEARQVDLTAAFGFECRCVRCVAERGMPESYHALTRTAVDVVEQASAMGAIVKGKKLRGVVDEIEQELVGVKDAEVRRWCRASFVTVYYAWFNAVLAAGERDEGTTKMMARLQNELFFSIMAVNKCSSEHLSLLHVCYESSQQSDGPGSKLARFWFAQLKELHRIRYGDVCLERLGELLMHTKHVLRRLDGFRTAKWQFL